MVDAPPRLSPLASKVDSLLNQITRPVHSDSLIRASPAGLWLADIESFAFAAMPAKAGSELALTTGVKSDKTKTTMSTKMRVGKNNMVKSLAPRVPKYKSCRSLVPIQHSSKYNRALHQLL